MRWKGRRIRWAQSQRCVPEYSKPLRLGAVSRFSSLQGPARKALRAVVGGIGTHPEDDHNAPRWLHEDPASDSLKSRVDYRSGQSRRGLRLRSTTALLSTGSSSMTLRPRQVGQEHEQTLRYGGRARPHVYTRVAGLCLASTVRTYAKLRYLVPAQPQFENNAQ